MSIVVITKEHYRGRRVALPHLGSIEVPANGEIVIEDHDKAHAFVASLPKDIKYKDPKRDDLNFKEPVAAAVKSQAQVKAEDTGDQGGNGQSIFDDLDDEEKAEYIGALSQMTHKQLTAMCAPFPGGEWRGKKKEELVQYITGKLQIKPAE